MPKTPTEMQAEQIARREAIIVSQGGLYAVSQFVATNPPTTKQVSTLPGRSERKDQD